MSPPTTPTPAAELLAFLRGAGFVVTAKDGKVFVTPREKLSPAECGQIVALKAGLLEALADERWERCQSCLSYVDTAAARDLPFGSCQPNCPYLPKKRPEAAPRRAAAGRAECPTEPAAPKRPSTRRSPMSTASAEESLREFAQKVKRMRHLQSHYFALRKRNDPDADATLTASKKAEAEVDQAVKEVLEARTPDLFSTPAEGQG